MFSVDELLELVHEEITRVFPDGFTGEAAQYEWLLNNYNITEEEDVKWQLIFEFACGELPIEDQEDEEVMGLIVDEVAVHSFLTQLLQTYRGSTEVYIRS